MSLYLVTGGAGFIGSHLAEELLQRGERVRVLDNFSSGKRANLSTHDRLEIVEGDIRNQDTVKRAMSGVDYVLHQAALPSVQRSVIDPSATNEVNVSGTLNLLLAARDEKVRRFVFASSSSVYGNSPTLPKHEDMAARPLTPYAVSKLAGETYCLAFQNVYSLPTVALRYFNVFGPKQDPTSEYSAVIPRFITALLKGQPPTIYGDGQQSRDFTYIENVVQANLLACEREEAVGRAMNVACGECYTLLDLHKDLCEIIGVQCGPIFQQARSGDVKHSMAAIDHARELLNYRPEVGWYEGLRRTVEWYRSLG